MIITSDLDFWQRQSQLSLLERISTAPPEVIDYVTAVNLAANPDGLHVSVSPYLIPPDFLMDVQAAVAELPAIVKSKLEPRLLGIFFASGVGSSAITDVVAGPDGRVLGALVLFDAEAFLMRSANAWMAWKESTPFAANADFELRALIADQANDHRQSALQYLLLHEFGHVLSVDTEFLPNWWIGSQKFRDTEEYSFLSICWQIAMNGNIIPLIRHHFEQRPLLTYYGSPQLNADQMPAVYQALSRTAFPSLYASTSVYEDFAESFATYVHVVLMHKPWQIQLFQHANAVVDFADYWTSSRAQRKAQLFAEFLGAHA